MSDRSVSQAPTGEPADQSSTQDRPQDRRRNLALRALVDEMMTSIRGATQGHLWTTDERSQYERELAVIMTRVRSETVAPQLVDPSRGP